MQNDDEELVFMYNAYLHKLLTSFLSQPVGRDKIKELKDSAMVALDTYTVEAKDLANGDGKAQIQNMDAAQGKPFISLLRLIGEVYQREPELIIDNEDLWNFVRFAGEDHTSYWTLVAFLNMLTSLVKRISSVIDFLAHGQILVLWSFEMSDEL
jgi:nuclear pore complex protein Nup205